MNSINLQDLIKESKTYWKVLRFESKNLSVETKRGWRNFDELITLERNEKGEYYTLSLEEILLDTGNTNDFCLLATEFKESFMTEFYKKNLELEDRLIGSTRDSKVIAEATKKVLKFKIFNTMFISKIGFINFVENKTLKTTFNIGMYCINQFLNILFFENKVYYYFCSNL